jgi:pilus assembly protein CpaE
MSDTIARDEAPPAHIETADLDGVVVLVSASDRETQAVLTQAFGKVNGIEFEFAGLGLVPLAAVKSAIRAPDALFFQARDEEQAEDWIEALRQPPGAFRKHLVALIPSPTKAATSRLLQAGADDVLSVRPDSVELMHTLSRARTVSRDISTTSKAGSASAEPTEDLETRVIMFIHAAGGSGATTLAVNSAVQLHNRIKDGKGGACMIDLDFQFGDAHLHLDLPVQSRMLDLANSPGRLDRRMLDTLMINAPGGLKVLTSPEAAMPLDGVGPEAIDTILSLARRRYRYVVVDMPHALAHWTEAAMRRADHIFLVTQINVPALRAARRLLDTIREEGVTRAPISIIANRYGGKTGSTRLPLAQAARALDRDVSITIPNDYQLVMESLDSGVPVSTAKPGSKFALAVGDMLDAAVGAKVKTAASSNGLMASIAKLGRKG